MTESNDTAITIASVAVGAFFAFATAYWIWPWLGPQMFQPCPVFTPLGMGLYITWHAFRCIGLRIQTVETDRIKRRLAKLEETDLTLYKFLSRPGR